MDEDYDLAPELHLQNLIPPETYWNFDIIRKSQVKLAVDLVNKGFKVKNISQKNRYLEFDISEMHYSQNLIDLSVACSY